MNEPWHFLHYVPFFLIFLVPDWPKIRKEAI